jgi:hypothetical protein
MALMNMYVAINVTKCCVAIIMAVLGVCVSNERCVARATIEDRISFFCQSMLSNCVLFAALMRRAAC